MLNIIKNVGRVGAECLCTRCNSVYTTKCRYSSKKSRIGHLCNQCKFMITNITELTQKAVTAAYTYDPITGDIRHRLDTFTGKAGEIATVQHDAGYLSVNIGKKSQLAHRIIFLYMTGVLPNEIDHINHIRNDNRWSNLREVTPRINHLNESLSKNSVTGITGVSLHKPTGKYRAYIMVKRKHIHLGLFDDVTSAAKARAQANIKYGFHVNHGK